jgi:hypothetical protein
MEVVDLSDPSNVCRPSVLDDYPIDYVAGASGGLLNNKLALICGGYKRAPPFNKLDDCFAITHNAVEANVKLTQARSESASVVLNGNTLWMTGGALDGDVPTNSTEFVQPTGTRRGPDLPLEIGDHCLVSLNDTTILLIGGWVGHWTGSKATFYYNTDHETWTEGPSLITGRAGHSCALFKSPQDGTTDTVIVTGGYSSGGSYLASTEFLHSDSQSWTSGT